MKKIISRIVCVVFLLILVGCTTTKMTRSGFLRDYSNFNPDISNSKILINYPEGREKSFAKIKECKGFIIDPIVLYISPKKSEELNISAKLLAELSEYFYDEIVNRLKKYNYKVVDKPAKGILRVKVALTDIVPSKFYWNLHWATKLIRAGAGGASVEAEIIDSVTQKRVIAFTYARQGRGIMAHKGIKKWDYTKDSIQQWVTLGVRRLNRIRSE